MSGNNVHKCSSGEYLRDIRALTPPRNPSRSLLMNTSSPGTDQSYSASPFSTLPMKSRSGNMRPKSAPSCRPGNGNLELFNTPGNRSPMGTPQLIKEKRLDSALPIATDQKGPKVQENQAQEVQNPLFQPHSPSISERSYGYTSIPIGYTHPNPSPRPHSPSPPIYEEIDQYQSPRKDPDLTQVQDIEFSPSRSSTPSTGSSTITLDNSSGIHPSTSG